MGSTFEETVLDFDLNFLHQSSNNVVHDCRIEKQRKALLVAKKKTIATDSLIKKYYSKRDQLEQTEVLLLSAKEECKQVCIDYKNSLEKCEKLEKDVQLLLNENKELHSNCVLAQNQVEAIKSHAHQLQVLVKEHETVIEALKIENQLEKNNVKDYEKNLSALQKENVTLLNDLYLVKDIALGKKKLHKRHKSLLDKYEKHKNKCIGDIVADSSCDETDLCDSSPPSPLFSYENKNDQERQKLNENNVFVKKDSTRLHEDHDSDYSNEIVSEDTGRGSSLAFSDGDKCFNSPDYFCTDSPIGSDYNKTKETRVFVNSCTSPIMVYKFAHKSTSPLLFDDEALLSNINTPNETGSNSKEYFITDIPLSNEIVTIKERKKMIDVGTSTDPEIELINVSTSPVAFEEIDPVQKTFSNYATSPIQNVENCEIDKIIPFNNVNADNICDKIIDNALPCGEIRHTTIQNLSSQCEIEISDMSIQEKKCLERNNSDNLCNENTNDCEIEMILNTMRMTDKLITPIPKTPVKLSAKCSCKNNPSPIKHLSELPKNHTVCSESITLRQENKILQTSIEDLSKEIMSIKRILKNQLLMPETPKKQLYDSNKKHNIMSELFDDSSHEANLDGELNSTNIGNDEISEFAFSIVSRSKAISASIPPAKTSFIEESVSHIEEVIEDCQVRKDATLRTSKSRETSLHKDVPTVEVINNNTSESVPTYQSRKTIESNLRIEDETKDSSFCDSTKEYVVLNDKKDKIKCKKLSRLEKFRKKLIPKSKIKRINVPIRKLRSKVKTIHATKNNKTNAELLMSNKSAYENALKVMTQIKQKRTKDDDEMKVKKVIVQPDNTEHEVSTRKSTDSRRNSKEEYNNVSNIEIKQPVICLSQLKLSNKGDKEKPQEVVVTTSPKKTNGIILNNGLSPRSTNIINTRSRTKINQLSDSNVGNAKSGSCETTPELSENVLAEYSKPLESRRRLKRVASDTPSVESKRVLRSMNMKEIQGDPMNAKEADSPKSKNLSTSDNVNHTHQLFEDEHVNIIKCNERVRKSSQEGDARVLMRYTEDRSTVENSGPVSHPKESILCKMLEKYAKGKIQFSAKKIPDDISNLICKKLEEDIAKINELPPDKAKHLMNKLVEDIRHSWNLKNFLAGFMKYLNDPERKREMFNKVCSPPAPPMTKSEQVLLFVMRQLEMSVPNTVSTILTQIEYSLFQLNRSPEFDIIESLSHFYALLCRYFGLKNRLRLFLLDAMYCLQFKVVPLIKHCLDVWMHILPLAHMGIAKSPLVTCLVYLLHFYKCEDKFNRIQEIRFILNKKYFYQITDWNETKILEMFRNSIKELREIKVEKKMLRMAFIILAKRQGPKWCQKNIVKNMLLPMIEKDDVPLRIKQFCIELLGPLLKPYPIDMKVHCEIMVNQLLDMVDHKTPDNLKESIFTSLIYMNKHNQNRVTHSLLSWSPKHVSPEFEELMRDFVREKPLKVWKGILSRTPL